MRYLSFLITGLSFVKHNITDSIPIFCGLFIRINFSIRSNSCNFPDPIFRDLYDPAQRSVTLQGYSFETDLAAERPFTSGSNLICTKGVPKATINPQQPTLNPITTLTT